MTFSIVARSPKTGEFGIAIASSSPAVAARCAHARRGVGAVATQNITDPGLGRRGLALMADGLDARAAVVELLDGYAHADFRQLALVDRHGGTAVFSGAGTLGRHATAVGPGAAAAGNLLADRAVPEAMIAAFATAPGAFPARLLAGLAGGLAAGGEAGPVHSAGLLVVREVDWPIVDLRVDWAEDEPIAALARLWHLYAPQMEDYVARALDPETAPHFGVPGGP